MRRSILSALLTTELRRWPILANDRPCLACDDPRSSNLNSPLGASMTVTAGRSGRRPLRPAFRPFETAGNSSLLAGSSAAKATARDFRRPRSFWRHFNRKVINPVHEYRMEPLDSKSCGILHIATLSNLKCCQRAPFRRSPIPEMRFARGRGGFVQRCFFPNTARLIYHDYEYKTDEFPGLSRRDLGSRSADHCADWPQ